MRVAEQEHANAYLAGLKNSTKMRDAIEREWIDVGWNVGQYDLRTGRVNDVPAVFVCNDR